MQAIYLSEKTDPDYIQNNAINNLNLYRPSPWFEWPNVAIFGAMNRLTVTKIDDGILGRVEAPSGFTIVSRK